MSYRPFEVTGLELEYPVVSRADLSVQVRVEELFRKLHGRPTSDLEVDGAGFSNELAAHVFELKTVEPQRSLVAAEEILQRGVETANRALGEEWDARLLPTGMHPFMRPGETELWPRAGREIYRAYDRVFGISGHGWLNVQSCHVNLPFGSEAETMRLHTAVLCLLPYLPALAASSPIYEGRLGSAVDNRLVFYRGNQARVPEAAGRVVPEHVTSFRQYRREVLEPIYTRLRQIPEAERLRHEWVNSRGAILRFWRRALEIRVLDVQECVRMDVAIAVFVRGVLRHLVERLEQGGLPVPPHDVLVEDLTRAIDQGSAAEVAAPHLGPEGRAARDVLLGLFDAAETATPRGEREYLPLVARRLKEGNLSEQIRRQVENVPEGERQQAIRTLYGHLADNLAHNRPYFPMAA